MQTKSYLGALPDPDVQYRVRFDWEHGQITGFMGQLEYDGPNGWQPVLRFDTAHGFPHSDHYGPDGVEEQHRPMHQRDYREALTYAIGYVKNNFALLAQPFRERHL